MNVTDQFEDLRPFVADEIPAAMQRIADSEAFDALARYVFPHRDVEEVRRMVRAIRTTDEFQMSVMYHVNLRIIRRSITRLTVDGLDDLDPAERYLFISNHRDIVLDAAFLNVLLYDVGYDMTQIAIGDNLLIYPWIRLLVRLNNSFIVKRNLSARRLLENSRILSAYIRHTLRQTHESIWIAQREGRAKDSNDQTQTSVLKMLCMAGEGDEGLLDNLMELNIVPIAISYEI